MGSRIIQLQSLERLLDIMDELREKCPWDRKQAFEPLRHLTIEETYELGDAILENNLDEIKNELGDLLLHIFFYSKIGSENKAFDIADVANQIADKLIRRHPHIYSETNVEDADQVVTNWEDIKLKEGKKGVLEGVPNNLPALVKAYRIQEKVSAVGFDWNQKEAVLEKVKEEFDELIIEIDTGDSKKMDEEFGDLIFSLVNYARFLKLNPENALERTNKKFIRRFNYIEDKAKKTKRKVSELSIKEMEILWQEAKKHE